jgi:hypothetical protein
MAYALHGARLARGVMRPRGMSGPVQALVSPIWWRLHQQCRRLPKKRDVSAVTATGRWREWQQPTRQLPTMRRTMTPILQPERRHSVRARFKGSVRGEQLPRSASSRVFYSITMTISERGVQLSSPVFLPIHSLLLVDVDSPCQGAPIRALGRVAWFRRAAYEDRWRLGLEFVELSDDSRARLRKILRSR